MKFLFPLLSEAVLKVSSDTASPGHHDIDVVVRQQLTDAQLLDFVVFHRLH